MSNSGYSNAFNEDKLYEIGEDSAMSEFMDEISDQAIIEFKQDRLRSYYLDNSLVMRPAVDALQEGKTS